MVEEQTLPVPSSAELRAETMLEPGLAFFNHGSFGAIPRPVFAAYQRWQREAEANPVDFMGRRRPKLLDATREVLAEWLHTSPANLVFVPNATAGVNTVARSLRLGPGDEVLLGNHEYGAIVNTWRYYCEKSGARLVEFAHSLPVGSTRAFVEEFCAAIGPRTRLIGLSHITSPSALVLPIAEICRRARELGIPSVIDGAHAVGQLDLAPDDLGADFYAGNGHKWLSAPRGSGFLYIRPEHHKLVDPLIISHGMLPGASLHERHDWQGTRDPAPWLTLGAAIEYQRARNWPAVKQRCHDMALEIVRRLGARSDLPPFSAEPERWHAQMISIPLALRDPRASYCRLLEEFGVVAAAGMFGEHAFLRVSVQGYNTEEDCERLCAAVESILAAE